MKFALYAPLPHVAMSVDPSESWDGQDAYARARDAVCTADQAGFDLTLVAQRFLGPDLDAWMMSGALAAMTSRIRIMTAIHPGFWNPQIAAKMGSTIDQMSGGRFAVNLVTGWWEAEHRMYGGAMLQDEARYERAGEFVELVRRLWSGETTTFHSRHYELDDVRLEVLPVGALPEIYGAGRSPGGVDLAARLCDWWFVPYDDRLAGIDGNLKRIRAAVDEMTERAAAYGRRLRYAVNAFYIHDEDEAAARAEAETVDRYGAQGGMARVQATGLGTGLIGSRNQILERIAALEDAGVELLLLKFSPARETLADFVDQILTAIA